MSLAEFEYNSACQESTQLSPFELDLGYLPAAPINRALPQNSNINAKELLITLEINGRLAKDMLQWAQDKQREQVNHHRHEEEFQPGEKVYLNTRNLQVLPKAEEQEKPRKLQHRFVGPYKILKRLGPVNYQLELPATSRIHPNFHVFLL